MIRRRSGRARSLAALAVVLLAVTTSACSSAGVPGESAAGGEPASTGLCRPTTAVVPARPITPVSTHPRTTLPVTVDSADGRKVTVTDTSRILAVNLYGSLAGIVFNLGLGDRVVGRDTSTTFPEAAKLPLVTRSGHDLTAESVLSLEPTVVIADDSIGPPEVLKQIRKTGVPVVMIDSEQTLAQVPTHVHQVADALGVPAAGDALAKRVRDQIASATRAVDDGGDKPTIAFLYLRGSAGIQLIGAKGAGSDAMIEAIGGIDAGTKLGLSGFRPLNSEGLIKAAPDVILVMTDGLKSVGDIDGMLKLPGVAQTPAGENRAIVDIDDGSLLDFGADTGRAIQALAEAVHESCASPTARPSSSASDGA